MEFQCNASKKTIFQIKTYLGIDFDTVYGGNRIESSY